MKGRKKISRRVLLIAGLVVVLVAVGLLWTGGAAGERFVTARIVRGDIRSLVSATGSLEAVTTVEVGSQVSGTIAALNADFNSQVRMGQVIVQLDPATYEAQVEQARANFELARANISDAQARMAAAESAVQNCRAGVSSADANLAALKAQLEDARSFLRRQEDLASGSVLSQRDLEIARTSYHAAEARHEQAAAQLEQARLSEQSAAGAGLAQAQAQLEQARAQQRQAEAALDLAQVNLSHTAIRSPIDGVVVSRKVNVGQTVAASLQAPTLFTIANDLRRMQIIASIDQADIGVVRSSNRIRFTVDAFPGRDFTGTIQQIRLDPQNVQNVVTYNAVIDVENPELKLMPGMTANINVTVDERTNVLRVPNAALRFIPLDQAPEELSPKPGNMPGGEGSPQGRPLSSLVHSGQLCTVWVLRSDSKPHPRKIRAGITDGVATEVLDGDLREGEAVIINKKSADKSQPPRPIIETGVRSKMSQELVQFSKTEQRNAKTPAVIDLYRIHKVYSLGEVELEALKGISLSVHQGEFIAIMGSSGSGKSTAMNILGCLDQPTSGTYLLDGQDVSQLSRDERADIRKSKIGFVFQNFNLLARTSALENVELPMIYAHAAVQERSWRATEALADVALQGRECSLPNQLSGGQQQRVAIARALVNNPSLILADEPTGNLDSRTSTEIMEIFQRLNRDHGMTLVIVTHEPDIAQFAKRVIVFKDGLISQDYPVAQVRDAASELMSSAEDGKDPIPIKGRCAPAASVAARRLPASLLSKAKAIAAAPSFTSIRVAVRALARNKVRSALTMLGIIIGVAAVIALVSIGEGAQNLILDQISGIGANLLFVGAGSLNTRGVQGGFGSTFVNTLTAEDIIAIQRECPSIAMASPVAMTRVQVVGNYHNWNTSIQGVNEKFPWIRKWELASGEFFSDRELRSAARVAVLGLTVAEKLFPGGDPVGQMIRIRELPFQVAGVLSKRGQDPQGRDQDDIVIAPYTTVQKKLLAITYVQFAYVSAISPDATKAADQEITALLRQRHRLRADQENDFFVRDMADIASTLKTITQILTIVLGCIAGISLIVGGIGIMNIMLVSVTERTREIGIRMAVGARPSDVQSQFLIEAIVLCIIGGLIGTVVGSVLSLIPRLFGWSMGTSALSIFVAVLFSAAVGIFFGCYPASKAAGLDPIEALRYE